MNPIGRLTHVFAVVGPWGSARFGLMLGAGLMPLVWLVLHYDPATITLTTADPRPGSGLADLIVAAMPYSLLVAVVGAGVIGWLAKAISVRVLVEKVRRANRSVRDLTEQRDTAVADLAAERELVARLAGGTDDIIAAARGAHHRTQGDSRG